MRERPANEEIEQIAKNAFAVYTTQVLRSAADVFESRGVTCITPDDLRYIAQAVELKSATLDIDSLRKDTPDA